MTTLTLAAVLQASIIATGANSYADARRETDDSGRPMVILVGADWCPACVTMKKEVVPKVEKQGLLKKVAYAAVNLDHQKELGQQLIENGPIPQVIMFRKTRDGWLRRKLIGGQNAETVEAFINEGIKLDDEAKLTAKDKAH